MTLLTQEQLANQQYVARRNGSLKFLLSCNKKAGYSHRIENLMSIIQKYFLQNHFLVIPKMYWLRENDIVEIIECVNKTEGHEDNSNFIPIYSLTITIIK